MYDLTMANQQWRERLAEEVAKSGRAETAICVAAGLRHAWYGEMMNGPTDPKVSYLLRFIKELGVSPAYIFTGLKVSPQTEELLLLLESTPTEARDAILTILMRSR